MLATLPLQLHAQTYGAPVLCCRGLNPHDPCDSPLVACCLLNVLHGNEPNRRGCLKWQLHAVETQYCGVDQEDKQLSLYTCNETDGQQHYMCFKHAGTGRV